MTRLLLWLLALLLCAPAAAAELRIGYLSLTEDPRYTPTRAEARLDPLPRGNGLKGAELGLADTQMAASARGLALRLEPREAADETGIVAAARGLVEEGVAVILVDLPAPLLQQVTSSLGEAALLINVSAPEDGLRCLPNLLHTLPSDRMAADALAQFLLFRRWPRVLMLVGEAPRDSVLADAFAAAAARFGLTIAGRRSFTLAADPEQREAHNLALLTGGIDYDVVFVAEGDDEFAPYLPYATALPRPVLGSAGLRALAWHHGFDRFGAPQVNGRFVRLSGRYMGEADWAAWMAVKAVAEAGLSGATDTAALRAYLLSEQLQLDGSKGVAMNFRPWDGQLRTPMLLATDSEVIAWAPFPGFAHASNDLDTLGRDAPEAACP